VEHVDVIGGVVGVGTAAAVWRDSGHNEVVVDLRQDFLVETQLRCLPGLNVVDEDVGLCHQFAQDDPPLKVVHIQGQASFARVQVEERTAAFDVGRITGKGTTPAGGVSGLGRLNLL